MNMQLVINMLENGEIIRNKEKVHFIGMMVKFMKENFNNVKDREKEDLNIQMEINMKEHLKMI